MRHLNVAYLVLLLSVAACTKKKDGAADVPLVDVPKASYRPRLADRDFVSSTFKSLYKSSDGLAATDTDVENYVQAMISGHSSFFGGPCQYYDEASCSGTQRDQDAFAAVIPTSSSPREALRLRVCFTLSGYDVSAAQALDKAGLTLSSSGDAQNLEAAYKLFFPSRALSPTGASLLLKNHAAWQSQFDIAVAWKLTLASICASPGWQVP